MPPKDTKPTDEATDEPTAVGIVAPGRTVDVPTGVRRVVGYDRVTGAAVYGPVLQKFWPGQEVTLTVSEITRLRSLGFLVHPDGSRSIGPHIVGAPQQPAATDRGVPDHWPSRQVVDH